MKQDWELKTLKDVGAIFSGNSINAKIKEEKYSGLSDGLPYVATKDIGYDSIINYKNGIKIPYDESGSFRIAPKNSVLICAEGGSAGRKIGRLAQDVCFVNKLFAITPDNEITSKYLYYWYKSNAFKEEFNSRLTGLIGGVSKRKFETIPIPIPPLEEQKQIVAKLDQCFEAIDKARANAAKNLENAKELFQSKLNEFFSQKGEDWVEKKLGDVCEVKDGTHDSPRYVEEGIPFVTQKNIQEKGFTFNKVKFITMEDHTKFYKRSNVEYNDIIISMIGANRGMTCIVDDHRIFSIKNVGLIKSNSKSNQKYILYYLKSPIAKNYILKNSKGSAQGFIGLGKLRDFPIPYIPINQQNFVVKNLDKIIEKTQNLESKYQQELNSLEELKKSILQKAFEGELV